MSEVVGEGKLTSLSWFLHLQRQHGRLRSAKISAIVSRTAQSLFMSFSVRATDVCLPAPSPSCQREAQTHLGTEAHSLIFYLLPLSVKAPFLLQTVDPETEMADL